MEYEATDKGWSLSCGWLILLLSIHIMMQVYNINPINITLRQCSPKLSRRPPTTAHFVSRIIHTQLKSCSNELMSWFRCTRRYPTCVAVGVPKTDLRSTTLRGTLPRLSSNPLNQNCFSMLCYILAVKHLQFTNYISGQFCHRSVF